MSSRHLGPYRLERTLGHGGMGTVYAGVHEGTQQRAAIKVLAENLCADPRFRERFRGEVETLRMLHHPNIVQLHGYGEEDGRLFFVMELVDGPSLESELHAGHRFGWREAAGIAIQVCGALKHAHDHGVIHRDLKPANLLIDSQGKVKLTDFGIAKLFGVSGLTLAGSMIGTPDYMSPEQTEGQPATSASDLYSLGCVMYALMTGKPPFAGSSVTEVIGRVRSLEATPLRLVLSEVPEQLDAIIAQLLSKNPAQRVPTPLALAHLLQAMMHALSEKTVESAPPPVPPKSESADLRGKPGAAELPPEGLGTGERPTLDFTPEQVQRLDAGKSDFRVILPTRREANQKDAAAEEMRATRPQQHFTAVAPGSGPRGRFAEPVETPSPHREWLAIAGSCLLLAGIAATVVWALLPPSADRLYQRIQQSSRQEPPPDGHSRDLADFLASFPTDPRSEEVRQMREESAWRALRDELSNKVRSLSEAEKLYLLGLHHMESSRTSEACECFQQIVDQLDGSLPDALGATDRRLRERGRYLLKKLDCRLAGASSDAP